MIEYKLLDYIKDRDVFSYKIITDDEVILEGEWDTDEETEEQHRTYLKQLAKGITEYFEQQGK